MQRGKTNQLQQKMVPHRIQTMHPPTILLSLKIMITAPSVIVTPRIMERNIAQPRDHPDKKAPPLNGNLRYPRSE